MFAGVAVQTLQIIPRPRHSRNLHVVTLHLPYPRLDLLLEEKRLLIGLPSCRSHILKFNFIGDIHYRVFNWTRGTPNGRSMGGIKMRSLSSNLT